MADYSTYCAAKAGVLNFTKSMSHVLPKWGIRINAVCPAGVHTALVRTLAFERQLERLRLLQSSETNSAAACASAWLLTKEVSPSALDACLAVGPQQLSNPAQVMSKASFP